MSALLNYYGGEGSAQLHDHFTMYIIMYIMLFLCELCFRKFTS